MKPSLHLVIFDIDGTLTATMEADQECFVRALFEVCGFEKIETDWSSYRHATDSGILHELHEARLGRPPSAAEVSRFRQHFVELLGEASTERAFASIAGAPQLLERLTQSAEYRVALATGAWRDAARLKMASAGLCYEDYPAASSDDAMDRESILNVSMQRAAERHGGFDGMVYVGDGVWDARASRALSLPFIGIGTGVRAARLSAEGARYVFPDFSDMDLFLESLDEIRSPAGNGRTPGQSGSSEELARDCCSQPGESGGGR